MDQTPTQPFYARLTEAWESAGTFACVGLDPELAKIPAFLQSEAEPHFQFCKEIVDATADLVCAFKPQIAYFAAARAEAELEKLCQHIKARHPTKILILDAKRGDIGSTAELYAREAFDRYGADAVTVNPYLGGDAIAPFSSRPDRGVFLLCKTSNPGSRDLQDYPPTEPLYMRVAKCASLEWNHNRNLGLVVGATHPEELSKVRTLAPDLPFLVPGVGAQGGDPKEVMRRGSTYGSLAHEKSASGLLINSSRAILYASGGADFALEARKAAQKLSEDCRVG